MPWRDAAIISLVLTLTQFFVVFLPLKGVEDVTGSTAAFIFDSIQCVGASFFSNFIALAGLREYAKKIGKKE